MAEDSNMKMEALKKVYAEIILNTSKEAAARVMVAEHKARSFEQQLISLKEESISMLLRLKDHFNSKIAEAEARSLEQQLKIEELEAQLCEAEGITVDLRGELRQVQEKLDILRRNQKKSSNDHVLLADEPFEECVPQDNGPNPTIISLVPDYEEEGLSQHPTAISNMFCHTMNNTNVPVESHLKQLHAPNDDISSIIMQNREANHCRNGCTQRIHALEGNLSNVRVSSSQSEDEKLWLNKKSLTDAKDMVKDRLYESDDNDCCREPLYTSKTNKKSLTDAKDTVKDRLYESDNNDCCREPFYTSKTNKNIPLGQLLHRSSSYKDHTIRTLRRSSRKCSRYREAIASLQGSRKKKFGRTQVRPFHGPLRGCSSEVNVEAVEIPVDVVEMDPEKMKIGCVSKSHELSFHSENAVHTRGDGKVPRDASSDKFLNVAGVPLLDSVLFDVPISEGSANSHRQLAEKNRFLKFTFQRKRRKNVLGKMDENILHNRVTVKRRLEDPVDVSVVENNMLKHQLQEDTDKMQQVDHQLISLTGTGC